jgi:Domain of unknown function (DUF1707)
MEAPVTAGRWDPVTVYRTGRDRLRASDADREQVVDTLATAFVQGRLGKDEFCARAGQALASRTYGEPAAITLGIPPRREAPSPGPPGHDTGAGSTRRRSHGECSCSLCQLRWGPLFLTHYVAFFALFVIAFIGVTVTAQPDG